MKDKELYEKINGMNYSDAVDRYLYEALDEPLLYSNTRWAFNCNDINIRRAKRKIYNHRGYATLRDYSITSILFFFLYTIYCTHQLLHPNSYGYGGDYSVKVAIGVVMIIASFITCKYAISSQKEKDIGKK